MSKDIINRLISLEKEQNIKIIFACETGSRAYGISSSESDTDIRFIYVNNLDHYLSFENKGQSICIREQNYDICGWDIKRALELLKKSNLSVLEALHSPCIYLKDEEIYEKLISLSKKTFNPVALHQSFLNIIRKNYNNPEPKSYFYVIRAYLSILWLKQFQKFPPLNFQELLNGVNLTKELKTIIKECIARRFDCRHPDLDKFIEDMLQANILLPQQSLNLPEGELIEILKFTIFKYFPPKHHKLEKLKEDLKNFVEEREWEKYHSLKNLAISVSIESAELLEHFQWWDKNPENLSAEEKKEISYEIADIFTYLLHICRKLDIDIVDTALEKLEKTKLKYPPETYRGKYEKPK